MSDQNLRIVVDALFRGKGEIDAARKETRGLEGDTKGAGEASKKAGGQMNAMAAMMKTAVVGAAIGAGYAMVNFAKNSIQAASALEAMESKFKIVFGSEAARAEEALSEFARSVGRSTSDLMGLATAMQDTFVPMGFTREYAADLSLEMVKLATDLSSFNNMSMDEALRALQGTLVGAHRNALQFGVIINENVLSQELMRMGAADLTGEMLEQAKVQARINLLLAGTTDAHGNALATIDEHANVVRALDAAKGDLAETLGGILLPAVTETTKKMVEYTRAVEEGLKLASGDYRQATADMTTEIVEQADSVDDLIKSAQGLNRVYNEMSFAHRMIGGGMVRDSMRELATGMAEATDSFEDFQAVINRSFDGQSLAAFRTMLSHLGMTEQQFYEASAAARNYARAVEGAAQSDGILTRASRDLEAQFQATRDRLDPLTRSYADASSEAAELMGAYDELVVKGARAKEAAIAKAAATDLAAEADRAAASAAQTLATEQGKLFTEALNGTPIQDDLSASIIRAGQAAGLSAEKLAILAGQFGDYTDEAIEAALKSALIAQKMDELVEAFGRGDISVTELRANLARYIETLDAIPDAIATDVTANVRINVNWPSPQEMAAGMPQPAGMPPGTQLYSEGGLVGGGIRGRDSVPALLTPGEIVLPTSATTNMTAAMDFLRDYMPGQTTGTMGGGVHIESGAIVINAGPGMDSGAIADAVLNRIDRQLGQRAGARARL